MFPQHYCSSCRDFIIADAEDTAIVSKNRGHFGNEFR